MLYGKSLNPQTLTFVRSQVFDDESVARSRARTVARRGRRRATATDLDTRTLSLTHLLPPARWPCRWRWPLPRRAALGVDCPLVFGLGKRSWLTVGCLTSGYCVPGSDASGDRPGGGRLPARVCRRRARLHVLTRHDHSVSRGRWGVCRLRRGPVGSGPGGQAPHAARGYVSSGRAKSPKWPENVEDLTPWRTLL